MRVEDANQSVWEAYEPVDAFDYPEYEEETGLAQNWRATLGNFIDEDLSISEAIHTADLRERNEQLREYAATQEDPDEFLNRFRIRQGRGIDYGLLAEHVSQENPDLGIKTNQQFETEMVQELAMRRDYYDDVRKRAGIAGEIGAGLGVVQGVMLDPLIWPGLVLGPQGAVGATSFVRGFGYSAGRVGAYTAAEEAVIQSQVYPWKQRIGSPYSITDVGISVLGAGAGGALVGGLAGGIDGFLRGRELPESARADLNTWMETPDGRAAVASLREIERELKHAPPEQTVQEFSDGMDAAYADFVGPPRPDTSEALPNRTTETEDEAAVSTLNQELDGQIASVEAPEVDLVIPIRNAEGVVQTRSLKDSLQELDVEEQQWAQIRDCLVNG